MIHNTHPLTEQDVKDLDLIAKCRRAESRVTILKVNFAGSSLLAMEIKNLKPLQIQAEEAQDRLKQKGMVYAIYGDPPLKAYHAHFGHFEEMVFSDGTVIRQIEQTGGTKTYSIVERGIDPDVFMANEGRDEEWVEADDDEAIEWWAAAHI